MASSTVKAALITGVLGIVAGVTTSATTGLFGLVDKDGPAATPTQPTAAPVKPVEVSVDKQRAGLRKVTAVDEYAGGIANIQANQLVWLFTKQMTHSKTSGEPSAIYATSGPCDVDVKKGRWSCTKIGVGGPASDPSAPGTYRVWVAIIDPSKAFELVQALRSGNHTGELADDPQPKGALAMDEVDVVRE
jgi:hypothetical protein